jgi:hypothetical protein
VAEPSGSQTDSRPSDPRDVEVVAGVVSYQHAGTIEGVLRSLDKALRAHFPDTPAAIVHCDVGSTDATRENVARVAAELPLTSLPCPVPAAQLGAPPVHGVPGADLAVRALIGRARAVGARVLLLVGGDLRALPDGWVERLVRPVREGAAELVTPLFARHVLDGTLTSCLLYPLSRALYGSAVQQAMTAELACSTELAARVADGPGWGVGTRAFPLALITGALAARARVAEAWLGVREAEPRERRVDLGDLMSEVVGAAFALAAVYEEQWRDAGPSAPPIRVGDPVPLAPPAAPVANQPRLVAMFRQGLRDLIEIWEQALRAETVADLYPLAEGPPEEFRFAPDLWARVVYDVLLAYRFGALHRRHLLRSLVPLYLGRVAGLMTDVAGQPASRHERLIERQARAFEEAKVELVDRWR